MLLFPSFQTLLNNAQEREHARTILRYTTQIDVHNNNNHSLKSAKYAKAVDGLT